MTKRQASPTSSSVRTIAILMAVISVLYLARDILIPLSFAITLALILTPAVALLQKIRFGRVPAVALVMIVTIAARLRHRLDALRSTRRGRQRAPALSTEYPRETHSHPDAGQGRIRPGDGERQRTREGACGSAVRRRARRAGSQRSREPPQRRESARKSASREGHGGTRE